MGGGNGKAGAAVLVNSAAKTLTINAGSGKFTLSGSTSDLSGLVVNSTHAASQISGVLQGSMALTYNGGAGGLLSLLANNTYTGITTIGAGGTLKIGSGSTVGTLGTGSVVNNGVLSFNRTNTYVVTNQISGSGSVIQAGSGNTSLTNANTYSGGTTLSSGTLGIYDNSALGTGALTASGSTTLLFGRSVTNFANNVTLNGSVTFDLDTSVDYLVVGGGGGGG